MLNLINIHDPLPAHWMLRDFPQMFTPSPLTRQLKKQNKVMLVVKQSSKTIWMQVAAVTALCVLLSSECCSVVLSAARDSSLCVATCCTGFTELLIPNKDARAAAVWAEAMCIGHANQLAKGSKRLKN